MTERSPSAGFTLLPKYSQVWGEVRGGLAHTLGDETKTLSTEQAAKGILGWIPLTWSWSDPVVLKTVPSHSTVTCKTPGDAVSHRSWDCSCPLLPQGLR